MSEHPCCADDDRYTFVNDETMAAIRRKYDTLDRMLKSPAYEGKQVAHEIRHAFAEIRALRAGSVSSQEAETEATT